jgi:hypothetical protein
MLCSAMQIVLNHFARRQIKRQNKRSTVSLVTHKTWLSLKPGFHMVVMVVKIESRSFSTASL